MSNFDISTPDDYTHWYVNLIVRFKKFGNNDKEISWKDVFNIMEEKELGLENCPEAYFQDNPLEGIPGEGLLKNKSGIYAFVGCDDKRTMLYIGKALNVRQRFLQHFYNPIVINKIWTKFDDDFEVCAWYMKDIEQVEVDLIKKHTPLFNIHNKKLQGL